jgi:carbamoyltransferase
LDGEGDMLCATVNIYDGKTNSFKKISETDKGASLGYLYALATLYLGMKPNQHEFKVMGLAPYAKKDKVEETYEKIKDILWVDGLEFKSKFRMQYADYFFADKMKFTRFDNVAGAVQKLSEELTLKWVSNAIKKTGIKNIALSGGVFMNVKANQRISEMPEVEEMFCVPSAGDESTAIGACMFGYKKYCEQNKLEFKPLAIEDLYLGPEYNQKYVENLIETKNLAKKYKITYLKNVNKEIARLLANGEIVARCSGRSEWGARALGNRSILANPVNGDTIRILNETIKDRDFWMPFTPSIIEEDISKYSLNPKKIKAPYMAITFNSTEKARKELPAAMHPYDFTIRPQAVYKSWNPDYHEVISEFKKKTGTGALLNTSFNLHGEPNVLTPEDAFHTVENSSLKYLVLGNYLFEKR